jgi:hypothetical protein
MAHLSHTQVLPRADKLELVKAQLLVHFRQMPKCLQLSAKIDCADSER